MPKMVLNRNFTLRTTTPWSVQFEKDKPVEVHPSVVHLALGIGAVMADGSAGIQEENPNTPAPTPAGPDRSKAIQDAIEKTILRNQRGDFTASGLPDLRRLNAMLGFDVEKKELIVEWDKYNESKDAQ